MEIERGFARRAKQHKGSIRASQSTLVRVSHRVR
jgi:hypothetical protein